MICDECGETLEIGAWPWCPHTRGVNTVVADDIPGGKIFENGFDEPTRFDSHSAHRRALAERGLEIRAKNAGPEDRQCPRWDSVDLDGAAQLVRRGLQARQQKREAPIPITVREIGTFTAKDFA